jgi:hypothetical protein
MRITFSRCNEDSLANVPIKDGQLIYVKDLNELYLDVGTTRIKYQDKELLADIEDINNKIANIEAMHSFDEYNGKIVASGTTEQFFSSIQALNLNVGTMLLGQCHLTDAPTGLKTEEVKVEVYPNNVLYCTMRSGDTAPYEWTCNSYEYRGWESKDTSNASSITFDNADTDLTSITVQAAIKELNDKIGTISELLDQVNG